MNTEKFKKYFEYYISNPSILAKNEGYKWKVLETIQNDVSDFKNKNICSLSNASDKFEFVSFITNIVKHSNNLIDWRAKDIMNRAVEKYPEKIFDGFKELFYGNDKTEDRMQAFAEMMKHIAKDSEVSSSGKSGHDDFRAISTYLGFIQPCLYNQYKYSFFKYFANEFDVNIPKKSTAKDCYLIYISLCEEIKAFLKKEHTQWFYDYISNSKYDKEGNLLIQDIFYCLQYYKSGLTSDIIEPKIINVKAQSKSVKKSNNSSAKKIDFERLYKENINIGAKGEKLVFDNEKRLAESRGFDSGKIVHVSKQDDTLGYDIKSLDENGNEMFIEVKTTAGGELTPFYLSANELECSKENSDKYRLYRVYNLKEYGSFVNGKISVIKGSLEEYCTTATSYQISLKKI